MSRETRVTAYEAEMRLALLLDLVAQGETVVITRRGEAVALLAPPQASPRPEAGREG
ncbi:type II toxin-antitoxin system prevent-host-death family antitoxin [Roseomonas stagni]|uniref:Type II toxin-antitoxin system prevent-host-death family antitoxin n=1 Tax=Falsiroseomonas algicola TaxID=2716930 RepID=A0A6M1LWQ2_9PROT|nr:type II toxin-antitoxin system prevent-host-death family antitoxin [Falsiroseomonas algicola]NGM23914.1 type II toxin-antitoxin system prevent-host-death family antitoxin [Falsiroseomonas algicola]